MMYNKDQTVFVFMPVRDRAWILERTLKHLYCQSFSRNRTGLLFIVNDSRDRTFEILRDFEREHWSEYIFVSVWELNMGLPEDSRIPQARRFTTPAMGIMKNMALTAMMEYRGKVPSVIFSEQRRWKETEFTHFFYMDSDIILNSPETLKMLLNHEAPVVAGLTLTYPNPDKHCYNFMFYDPVRDTFYRDFKPPPEKTFEAEYVAGCFLVESWVCHFARFGHSSIGRDAGEDEAFMRACMKNGIKPLVDPAIRVEHVMESGAD